MGKVTIIVQDPNYSSSEMEKLIHEQLDKSSRSHGDYYIMPYNCEHNDTQVFVVPDDEEYPDLG